MKKILAWILGACMLLQPISVAAVEFASNGYTTGGSDVAYVQNNEPTTKELEKVINAGEPRPRVFKTPKKFEFSSTLERLINEKYTEYIS